MEASYQQMRKNAGIEEILDNSDGSDYETEQVFKKLYPDAKHKLMDILTGKVKEPKRGKSVKVTKSYVDPYKPIQKLQNQIADADSMLTAAELETKMLLTKSLARFQHNTFITQSIASQQQLAIEAGTGTHNTNAMLIDEKNMTIGNIQDMEVDFDAIAPLPVNSTKSYVNQVDFATQPVVEKHVIDPATLTVEMQQRMVEERLSHLSRRSAYKSKGLMKKLSMG
jgi:hypothetical protein